jgi:hypothetical protein
MDSCDRCKDAPPVEMLELTRDDGEVWEMFLCYSCAVVVNATLDSTGVKEATIH